MSSLVFPSFLLGQKFTRRKSPIWNTHTQRALSGKESRIGYRAYPLYEWELEYELLRDDQTYTNYVTWSQNAENWNYVAGGTGVTPALIRDYAIAPDGTLTADRIIFNKGSGTTSADLSYVGFGTAVLSQGTTYTLSFWIRTNDGSTVQMWPSSSSLGGLFNVGPSWQRVAFTWSGALQFFNNPQLMLEGTLGTSNYADISIWGVQINDGVYALPYMPTFGAAVQSVDLRTAFGLFNQMLGQYDSFLYQDPDFNTVTLQKFGVGNGSTTQFQLTATYQPGNTRWVLGGGSAYTIPGVSGVQGLAGVPELIQNTIGPPQIYITQYGWPAMLSIGSRTNLCLYSQDLTNANWVKQGFGTGSAPTVTGNYATAPDGTATASRVQFNKGSGLTSSDISRIYASTAVTGVYTGSIWLKTNDGSTQKLILRTGDAGVGGVAPYYVVVSVTGTWQRFYLTSQIVSAAYILVALEGDVNSSVTADILMACGQIEPGAYATEYMATTSIPVNNGGADYVIGSNNLIEFTFIPTNGAVLMWSGSFYYRCRFSEDKLEFSEFMHRLWENGKVAFEQVIL